MTAAIRRRPSFITIELRMLSPFRQAWRCQSPFVLAITAALRNA